LLSAIRIPLSAFRNPQSAVRFPLSAFRFPHSAFRNPLAAFRNPLGPEKAKRGDAAYAFKPEAAGFTARGESIRWPEIEREAASQGGRSRRCLSAIVDAARRREAALQPIEARRLLPRAVSSRNALTFTVWLLSPGGRLG